VLFDVGRCDAPTYAVLRELAMRVTSGQEGAA